jgi:hypothetical protein
VGNSVSVEKERVGGTRTNGVSHSEKHASKADEQAAIDRCRELGAEDGDWVE